MARFISSRVGPSFAARYFARSYGLISCPARCLASALVASSSVAARPDAVKRIDTAGFYGPAVVNELIREALHPYPAGLLQRSATMAGG